MATVRFNTQFPGYEVLSELGRSNARVLKARHLATGDLVAIKHFTLNTDAETLRRFQRESDIMTGISHPNIVRIREVQLEAELPYIVMELIEGGSLRHLLAGQTHLDVPTATRLGLQMASAFKSFHPQGIAHRDLKPENILYRPLPSGELHFLLTDFGVARLNEPSNTLTGQSLMTYEYASPEQFNDPKNVGLATDYYSLGVVLYECLAGRVPFAMGDQSGIVTFMNSVLNDAPPALTVTPEGRPFGQFADVVQGLLAKKAADRISDPDELTWLLKQAELGYFQAGRTSQPNRSVPAPVNPPPVVNGSGAAGGQAVPVHGGATKPVSGGVLKFLALGIVALLGGAGVYYFVTDSSPIKLANAVENANPFVVRDSLIAEGSPPVDSAQIRRAKEAQRREQIQAAINTLDIEILNYKVGFIGGIKNARLKLNNPSPIAFTSVKVQVRYYKEKGGLYKSEIVYFTDILPYSSPARNAPNSDRGTRIDCKILARTPSQIQTLLDTSGTATETDSSADGPSIDLLN